MVRSATAEVEGYQTCGCGAVSDVTSSAAVVPDLTLLLAELLENATAFSPPEVPVEVSATLHTGCLIQIVDRGIGMSAERLAEENRRLVSRERLDVAPTTMLGLFVVGRLARRHGMTCVCFPRRHRGDRRGGPPRGAPHVGAGTGPLGAPRATTGGDRERVAPTPGSMPGRRPSLRPSPSASPGFPTDSAQ